MSDVLAAEAKMISATLRDVAFLNHLKVSEVDKLVSAMHERSYPAGETVFKQGEGGNEFFIVASGSLSVWIKKILRSPVQVATLGPRKYFGEMALVSKKPRMATIKTEVPTKVYFLRREDFDRILMSNPTIAAGINQVIQQRKVNNN